MPNSTIGYSTLPRALNADATALYSMFRNIAGSIGIAVVTSLAANRLQTHRAYLAEHLGPLDAPYQQLLAQHEARCRRTVMRRGRRTRRRWGC